MVTLRTIDEIRQIPNADRIVEARVGGWSVVVKNDEFQPGDTGVFFEIDAALPLNNPLFTFLGERGIKTFNNKEVHVLKTARLRGVYSQGLLLPFDSHIVQEQFRAANIPPETVELHTVDYADVFGVEKYEPPIVGQSEVIGNFPYEAQKTDSERVQNIPDEVYATLTTDEWYATEKLDGTSTTFVKRDGQLIAASRNWEVSTASLQGQFAARHGIADIMPEGAILQGELVGPNIQKNPLNLSELQFFVFSYQLGINPDDPLNDDFLQFVEQHQVPVLDLVFPATVEEAVAQADGLKSTLNPKANAEGIVWWNRKHTRYTVLGDRPNFKVINNKFLLKHDR